MLFDEQYSGEGIVCLQSIKARSPSSKIWVLCLTPTIETPVGATGATVVPLTDLEAAYPNIAATKSTRPWAPYTQSLKPYLVEYVFDNYEDAEVVTYVDSDMYFWGDPSEIDTEFGSHSFMVTKRTGLTEGQTGVFFNGGCFTCRDDENCRELLTWWKGKVYQWCLWEDGPDGAYCEAGYLNVLRDEPTLFSGTHVCAHPGINTAPWNIRDYDLQETEGQLTVDGRTLVCYHYRAYTKQTEVFDASLMLDSFTEDIRLKLYLPYHDLLPMPEPSREG
ncbi:MAG: hypothetical protein GWO44_11000 [Thermoplasmata archaeon]|nr:hypothetical protein [Thermoplasmata archaeon]NIY03761.1 hypothetical protein [Thermoplasmata archaeon]